MIKRRVQIAAFNYIGKICGSSTEAMCIPTAQCCSVIETHTNVLNISLPLCELELHMPHTCRHRHRHVHIISYICGYVTVINVHPVLCVRSITHAHSLYESYVNTAQIRLDSITHITRSNAHPKSFVIHIADTIYTPTRIVLYLHSIPFHIPTKKMPQHFVNIIPYII